MKRALVGLSVLSALAAAVPARAATYQGHVDLGVNHPAVPRLLYPMNNGTVGYVIKLNPQNVSDRIYTLTRLQAGTGIENPDVYWYTGTSSQIGDPCTIKVNSDTPTVETGWVCPGPSQNASWAIVVVRVGLFTRFSLSY